MDTDRLIFIKPIATLQEMAAHTAVLHIWQEYVSQSTLYKHKKYYYFSSETTLFTTLELGQHYPFEVTKLISSLQMQQSIENTLKKSFKNIQMEMAGWIRSFQDVVFGDSLTKYLYRLKRKDMHNLCWTQNLKINYVETALKMVSMVNLSEIQKFIVYCKYCMAKEIANFSPSSLRWNTVKILRSNILLDYWICRLKNETFTMPNSYLPEIESTYGDSNVSLDVAMAVYCKNRDKFGFSYFWDRLGANDQVTVAARILPDAKGEHQMHVMSNMSTVQQMQLVCEIPDVIMKNFITWLDTPENAISCWNLIKDVVTEERFRWLATWLFMISIGDARCDRTEECHAFLVHVWDTASFQLRNSLTRNYDGIITDYFFPCRIHTASGLKFMHRYFSFRCPQYRKFILLDNADKFAVNVRIFDPRTTMDFLELCLPNHYDRLEFEEKVIASDWSRQCLKELLHQGKIQDINVKLAIFTPNDTVGVSELKKQILQLNLDSGSDDYTKHYITNLGRWKELNEFIDGAFANDVSSALNFKKEIFFAVAKKTSFWYYPYHLDEIIQVMEHELPPDEVEVCKRTALNNLQEMIHSNERSWRTFDRKTLNKSLFWCLGDWDQVREFINRVPANMLR